ncbi:hypothetical protein NKH70_22830 [Mesorhizobium sp. M0991]|uniref:hypothetical protein n=1 Tax=Mesorhizobium sp. M0991 TaxID=2957043 RepID=UPI00333D712A
MTIYQTSPTRRRRATNTEMEDRAPLFLARRNARVAESLYRKATGEGREAVTAAIFWLKTRARWKETSIHELGGKLDTSVTFVTTYEDMKLL